MILASIYFAPSTLHPVYAASAGEVCIAANGSSSCPIAPPLLNTTFPSSPLTVSVVKNDTQPFIAFDISILTNHTVLKPASVSTTGTIMQGSLTTLRNCIGGTGLNCAGTDNADTLHLTVSSNALTTSPASGLLFTATFDVMAKTNLTQIGFQIGCSSTSVANVCVTIGNGSPTPVPETVQRAKYTNQPYFDFQPNENPVTVDQGGTSSPGSFYLNVTSINDFQGTVNIATIVNSTVPTVTLSLTPTPTTTSTISLAVSQASPQNFSYVTVHVPPTTTPGTYNITFVATTDSLPPNILYIPLIVPTPDFTIVASPALVIFNVSASGSSIIILNSIGNFSGKVNLSLTASAGLAASLVGGSSFNISLTSPASTTLEVSAPLAGSYDVNITATSGSLSHPITVKVTPTDFAMTLSNANPLAILAHSSASEPILFGDATTTPFNVTITLKTEVYLVQYPPPPSTAPPSLVPSTGISVSCVGNSYRSEPSEIVLNNTNQHSNFSTCTVTASVIGNYTVTAIGTSGSISNSLAFSVQVLGPHFVMAASPPVETITLGSSATATVTFTSILALNDTVSILLVNDTYINGLAPSSRLLDENVTVNASAPIANDTITITAGASIPPGAYQISITGTGKSSKIVDSVTILAIVVTTASSVNIGVTSIVTSASSATVGSTVNIKIGVQNLGKTNETFTLLALVGNLTVAEQNVTLVPGQSLNVTLPWHTSLYSPGSYVVGGKILAVSGQTNFANNVLRSATSVTLTAASSSLFSSPFILLALIIVAIVIVAAVLVLFILSRRKTIS
jgi:hypothetical protein